MLTTAGDYELDDDTSRLQLDVIWNYLSTQAYWGRWRQRADVEQQVAGSHLNLGCYAAGGEQVGYARVISDGVSTAYLADVFVLPEHRGHQLGHALVEFAPARRGAGCCTPRTRTAYTPSTASSDRTRPTWSDARPADRSLGEVAGVDS